MLCTAVCEDRSEACAPCQIALASSVQRHAVLEQSGSAAVVLHCRGEYICVNVLLIIWRKSAGSIHSSSGTRDLHIVTTSTAVRQPRALVRPTLPLQA